VPVIAHASKTLHSGPKASGGQGTLQKVFVALFLPTTGFVVRVVFIKTTITATLENVICLFVLSCLLLAVEFNTLVGGKCTKTGKSGR
jgi:hypothetical protein